MSGRALLEIHHAPGLVGPRQSGKTTLVRVIAAADCEEAFFDLGRAAERHGLEASEQALSSLAGFVVIDEIERQQELLEAFRASEPLECSFGKRDGDSVAEGYVLVRLRGTASGWPGGRGLRSARED